MKNTLTYSFLISLCLLSPSPLLAQEKLDDPDFIADGGRLYDKWWEELDLRKPTTTHSAYPATGKKKGANSWRCKECHGWDYQGRDGSYAKGSHFTGIKGIRGLSGASHKSIISILKNQTHHYDDVMLDYGLDRIASFVRNGQVDMATYIDRKKKQAKGNADNGKPIFNEWCKECHGRDGQEINFKDDDKPEYVGTVAVKNPWEALHKLRNGQPGGFVMGDAMPHMNDKLSTQEQTDLLRYLQTLPVK